MNRLAILVVILGLLCGGAFYLYNKEEKTQSGTITADRNFTVPNFDNIGKIVIKHAKMPAMYFVHRDNSWKLNDRYDVNQGVFVNVERALTNMRLLYIPSKAATPTIEKSIKESGITVELYEGADANPFKVIYVGTDTQKGEGTHMMLQGDPQPYVMHLPGLAGGLRSRFEQPEKNFKDKILYKSPMSDIASISVTYPKSTVSSFVITNTATAPTVVPQTVNATITDKPLNFKTAAGYLNGFESVGSEGLFNESMDKDSILNSIPYCTIELTKKNGTVQKANYYSYDEFVDKQFNARTPRDARNVERFYVYVDDKDLYVVQTRVFGHIFYGYEDFYQ